jgi:hypothetical protein
VSSSRSQEQAKKKPKGQEVDQESEDDDDDEDDEEEGELEEIQPGEDDEDYDDIDILNAFEVSLFPECSVDAPSCSMHYRELNGRKLKPMAMRLVMTRAEPKSQFHSKTTKTTRCR